MPNKIIFNESQQIFIKNGFSNGISCIKISKRLQVSESTIIKFLRENNFDTSKNRNVWKGKGLLREKINEIYSMYSKGLSIENISKKLNCAEETLRRLLIKNNIKIRKQGQKYLCNENFFEIINNENKAYFLGLMYADGNCCSNGKYISVEMMDLDILEKFKNCLKYTGPIRKTKIKKDNWKQLYKLNICSYKLNKDLAKWGCIQNKTYYLKFPQKEWIPENLMFHFIRGLFDGDGCLSIQNHKYNYWTIGIVGTKELCQGLCNYLKYGNIRLAYKNPKNNHETWGWNVASQNDVNNFLKYMYENATIYLERKYNKYQKFLKSEKC